MAKRKSTDLNARITADGMLPAEVCERIIQVREEIRIEEGAGGQCGFVVEVLHDEYGWDGISGVYLASDGNPIGDHVWNVLPDGTIVDGTADQFCEGHDVRIVRQGDPDHSRYRWEWTEDYNPDMTDRYPELTGIEWSGEYDMDRSGRIRNEKGQGWWLPDPSTYREWEPPEGMTTRNPNGGMAPR